MGLNIQQSEFISGRATSTSRNMQNPWAIQPTQTRDWSGVQQRRHPHQPTWARVKVPRFFQVFPSSQMAISCNKALHPREYHQNGWLCSWLWVGHRATRRGKPSWGSGNVSIWQVALGIAERHAEALTHLPLWEAKGNKHRATAETHEPQGWLKTSEPCRSSKAWVAYESYWD